MNKKYEIGLYRKRYLRLRIVANKPKTFTPNSLEMRNQFARGLEEQLLPPLAKQILKSQNASIRKNVTINMLKKSDRNKTKLEAMTTHQPQLSFFTAALLCLDTLAFQPFQRRLMTAS